MRGYKENFRIKRGIIFAAVGLLLGIILLPKVVPFWFNQLQSFLAYIVNFSGSHLIDKAITKELVAGAICATTYIDDAAEELEKERAFTEAEKSAFQNFTNEIQSLTTQSTHVSEESSNRALLVQDHSDGDDLKAVRNCYRETVMSVPRYDDVYDEPFAEHFAAEFGDELAVTVLEGGPLTQTVQSLLCKQAAQAVREREQFLEKVEVERRSVSDAKRQLTAIEDRLSEINVNRIYQYSFDDLLAHNSEIQKAKQECHELVNSRQKYIFEKNDKLYKNPYGNRLQELIYSSLPTRYPILSATLTQLQVVKDHGKIIRKSISNRY